MDRLQLLFGLIMDRLDAGEISEVVQRAAVNKSDQVTLNLFLPLLDSLGPLFLPIVDAIGMVLVAPFAIPSHREVVHELIKPSPDQRIAALDFVL